jgi:hypothetical protein
MTSLGKICHLGVSIGVVIKPSMAGTGCCSL